MSKKNVDECKFCNSLDTKIVKGTPPHAYKRECYKCKKSSWVSKNDVILVDKSTTHLYLMKFFISLNNEFKPGEVKNGYETYKGWTWYKPGYSKLPNNRLDMLIKSLQDFFWYCDVIGMILHKKEMPQSKAITLEKEILKITKKDSAFEYPNQAFKKQGKKNHIKFLNDNILTPEKIGYLDTTEDVANTIELLQNQPDNEYSWLDGVSEYRNHNAKTILLQAFKGLGNVRT